MTPRRKDGKVARVDRGRRSQTTAAGPLATRAGRGARSPSTESHRGWPCCDPELQRDLRAYHEHDPEIEGVDLIVDLTLEAWRRTAGLPPRAVGAPPDDLIVIHVIAAFVLTEWVLQHIAIETGPDRRSAPGTDSVMRWAAERLGIEGRPFPRGPADVDWARPAAVALWSRSRFAEHVPEAIAYSDSRSGTPTARSRPRRAP